MRLRFSLVALAALLLIPSAFAQTFTATLAGANEVPAVATAATGSVTATLDGTTVVVTGSFSGLESDYASNIGTHLHGGSAAENGPVVVPLTVALDSDNRGGTLEAAANTYVVRETFADSIRAGLVYVNVHSQGNTSGEIRGQLRPAADLGGIVINEIDADQTGTDTAEFVELYNGGTEAVVLDGAVLVLMNGSDDASYGAFDLDGFTIEAGGYFVFCNESDNVPNCDLEADVADNLIQNGADAVALYTGSAADFPTDTPATTVNLIDAVVYGTSDDADTDLLAALGETVQQDEDANGNKDTESTQRSPDGSETFAFAVPTPGVENVGGRILAAGDGPDNGLRLEVENPIVSSATVTFTTSRTGTARVVLYDVLGRRAATLVDGTVSASEQTVALEAGGLTAGVYVLRLETESGTVSRTVTVVR